MGVAMPIALLMLSLNLSSVFRSNTPLVDSIDSDRLQLVEY
jgi:hypothetical protein